MDKTPKRISDIPEEKLDKNPDMTKEAIAKTIDDLIYDSAVSEVFKEDSHNEKEIFPDIIKKPEKYIPTPAEQLNIHSYDWELQQSLAYIDEIFVKKTTNDDIKK